MATKITFKALGLDYVEAFTAAHQRGATMYEREQLCEAVQFPAALIPARDTDWLAGKRTYPEVGYCVQYGGMGFYADFDRWPSEENAEGCDASQLSRWETLREYWLEHDARHQCIRSYEPEFSNILQGLFSGEGDPQPDAIYPLFRMAGMQLDLRKLVTLGITGLLAELETRLSQTSDDEAHAFLQSCLTSLRTFATCIAFYADQAEQHLPQTPQRDAMITALRHVHDQPAQTFHQALQLVMLSSTFTGTINFGRLDTVLGDFLCRDLDAGTLTWEHAKQLLGNFYVLIEEEILQWDGRIIIGGKGRDDEQTADRFAMLAMEVTDELCLPMPQLSLRFYEGQNPELLDKAYDVIARGRTFPMLYNDDVNMPAVMSSFQIDEATAEQCIPYGCGEYMLYHASCHTPNGIINLCKVLELTINHGKCLATGQIMGPDTGSLSDYATFDDLWNAYDQNMTYLCRALAHAQQVTYDVIAKTAPFSFASMLTDDCLDRGRPIFAGGVKYLGGTCETYGNTNCADSLSAIKKLVYDEQSVEPDALLQALRDNWQGHERLRRACKQAPKYGNDDPLADDVLLKVHDHVCQRVIEAGEQTHMRRYLVVVINNSFNTTWGLSTAASADGRTLGDPLAPGNAPSGGSDRAGLTAVLNSQAKPDAAIHAGAVQNVKLSASFPVRHPELYRAVFKSYFKRGGTQVMVSVTNRADLEAALVHPEKYANLIVRVGGFSARFIDLDPTCQQEILSRTEHGG